MSKDNTCPHLNTIGFMDSKTLVGKYTCQDCGKKATNSEEMWGSGQQEDTTGHPTAETPDAQPLGNVSGKWSEILREHIDGLRKLDKLLWVGSTEQTLDNGKTYRCCMVCGLSPLRLAEALEALPRNNASESGQSPSPSEQEDKPTCNCGYSEALPFHSVGCPAYEMKLAPLTDSKPEKHSCGHDKCPCGLCQLNHDAGKHTEPSKPDQLREILNAVYEQGVFDADEVAYGKMAGGLKYKKMSITEAAKAIEALISQQVQAVQNEWNAAIDRERAESKQREQEARAEERKLVAEVMADGIKYLKGQSNG